MTTISTSSAPATSVCRPYSLTSSVIGPPDPMARKPADTSPAIDSGSAASRGSRAGSWMRHTIAADQAKAAAVKAKPSAGPPTATSTPPIAGPANDPTLSIVLEVALAAVSSSGVRASPGSIAASAGVNAAENMPLTPASP